MVRLGPESTPPWSVNLMYHPASTTVSSCLYSFHHPPLQPPVGILFFEYQSSTGGWRGGCKLWTRGSATSSWGCAHNRWAA